MRVVVFAKAPRPGFVKTRLGLDGVAAALVQEAFVRDTLELAFEAAVGPVELHTDVETDAWRDLPVSARLLQVPGDLGTRMLAALSGQPTLLVGSDAPTLPVGHLQAMARAPGDVVLGPAEDGGYWAILARRTDARMFEGVDWSTARTRAQTEAAARACGFTVSLGPAWFDCDEPGDLRRLTAAPGQLRPATREVLRRLASGERLS